MAAKEFLKYLALSFILAVLVVVLVVVLVQHDAFAPVLVFVSCLVIYLWMKVMYFENKRAVVAKKRN